MTGLSDELPDIQRQAKELMCKVTILYNFQNNQSNALSW